VNAPTGRRPTASELWVRGGSDMGVQQLQVVQGPPLCVCVGGGVCEGEHGGHGGSAASHSAQKGRSRRRTADEVGVFAGVVIHWCVLFAPALLCPT
jgi:hypothetical protein